MNDKIKFILIFLFSFLFLLTQEQSEIYLIVKGTGNINFINDAFYLDPYDVIINNESKPLCKKQCAFEKDLNNVTIKFNEVLTSLKEMFKELNNIILIDLSNLDTSKVTNMDSVFTKCYNLENIIFGNINTSLVNNMNELFYFCSKLTSIDLSHFDTSKVTTMSSMFKCCESLLSINVSLFNTKKVKEMFDMFAQCHKLSSINLSSFDTSEVTNMQGMFYTCKNLLFLDLKNFRTSKVTNFKRMFASDDSLIYINIVSLKIVTGESMFELFTSIPSNPKICANEGNTVNILRDNFGKNSDCGDICYIHDKIKIDLKLKECVKFCNASDYRYEYSVFCDKSCPSKTYPIYGEYICLEEKPEFYYLDLIN